MPSPLFMTAGAAGLGGVGLGTAYGWGETQDQDFGDRASMSTVRAVEAGGLLSAGAGGLYLGMRSPSVRARASGYFGNLYQDAARTVESRSAGSALSFLGRRWGLAAAAGGVIGAFTGDEENRGRNALVGASVAGLGAGAIGAASSRWMGTATRAGHSPLTKGFIKWGGGAAVTILGATALMASQDRETEGDAFASPDGYGSYDYSSQPSGVRDRSRRINATGDIVLGLHNKRHG